MIISLIYIYVRHSQTSTQLRYILSQITYNRKTKDDVDIGLSRDLGLSGDGPLHQWPHQACCYFHRALVQNECLENVPTEIENKNQYGLSCIGGGGAIYTMFLRISYMLLFTLINPLKK
jgi:hypothetical protein